MYNSEKIKSLVSFVTRYDGIADKKLLAEKVQARFEMTKDRSVFYCDFFAVRFCRASSQFFSNTVLSLSALQKYDKKPFIVSVVTPDKNYLMLQTLLF
ncbi:MAG: hypothetical protein IJ859_00025 [Synergistaceae bacterium]|nr:hypothetical protein [Synergistaceae bacterium]